MSRPSIRYLAVEVGLKWNRYNKAREIKDAQDTYCSKALAGQWKDLGAFPEDYQWEALVDVLRGRVKVRT